MIFEVIDFDWLRNEDSYVNSLNIDEKLELIKENCYHIINIINPNEGLQIEAVRRFKNYDLVDDSIVDELITFDKAKDLYYKLKKVRNIIK
jgi:hypothetical protein